MTREEAIKLIEALYPADCQDYPDMAATGQKLLKQAQQEIGIKLTWRNEPTRVLVRYAELCVKEEDRQARRIRSILIT